MFYDLKIGRKQLMVNSYYYFHFPVASHRSSHFVLQITLIEYFPHSVLQHSLVNIDFGFVNNNLVAKVPGLLCAGPLPFPVKIRNTKRHTNTHFNRPCHMVYSCDLFLAVFRLHVFSLSYLVMHRVRRSY